VIGIIDYGAGNLKSVEKAFAKIGVPACVSADAAALSECDALVLPGVGAFADAMRAITDRGFDRLVRDTAQEGKPFLGICLGMQVLFSHSEEGDAEGLGILQGNIRRIPDTGLKIPQIGWNQISLTRPTRLLEGLDGQYFYFVHSYYLEPAEDVVVAACDYGVPLSIAVEKGNLFATQFHPEKSSDAGLAILKKFSQISGF